MKTRTIPAVIGCSLILIAHPVVATNQTPAGKAACVFEPYGFSSPPMIDNGAVALALTNQGYAESLEVFLDDVPDAHATVTFDDFRKQLRRGLGALFLFTHGSSEGLGVEAYDSTAAGRDSCWDAFGRYCSAGWDPFTEIDRRQSPDGYHIAVRPGLVSSPSKGFLSRESIVHVASCFSWSWRDDWPDVRDYLAYDDSAAIYTLNADAIYFWLMLDGVLGKPLREVSSAAAQLSEMKHAHNGVGGTVLAPTVQEVTPSCEWTYASNDWFYCTVRFDCHMNTSACIEDLVSGDETYCYVDDVCWDNDTTLAFTVHGTGVNGTGDVRIRACCASSAGNCTCLDGNTEPDSTDGEGPNGDDFVIEYRFWDNQAAAIEFFGIHDGQVVWRSSEEAGTLAYRLLGSNDAESGQWQVASDEIPAEGEPAEYQTA
ncbi:MAG: hypothetical protein ABIF77_17295, partial [bacterium]